MSSVAQKLPPLMTVAEFLAWPGDGTGRIYELVDGVARGQDATSDGHGTIHARLIMLICSRVDATHSSCRAVACPSIQPRLRANWNLRIPEIAVTGTRHRKGMRMTPDPLLIVEVVSRSNALDTWNNAAMFSSMPSVNEMLVVESEHVGAHLLRRNADGTWPENPLQLGRGDAVELTSVGLTFPLVEAYRDTDLA